MRARALSLPLAVALLAACAVQPVILSGYRATTGPYGGPRDGGEHPAIDFGGALGDPVLAAAPGIVYQVTWRESNCGYGLRLFHPDFGRYTLYCQMRDPPPLRIGDAVARGQVIGAISSTGEPERIWNARGVPLLPHLHFEVATVARSRLDGDIEGTIDPLLLMTGCFDPAKVYPGDRFVLTFPVRCTDPAVRRAH